MALSSAVSALKQGVLQHVRLPLQQQALFGGASAAAAAVPVLSLWRGFAGGGYLDKDEVTQRVLDVTKHFEKIDPAKVSRAGKEEAGHDAAGSRLAAPQISRPPQ